MILYCEEHKMNALVTTAMEFSRCNIKNSQKWNTIHYLSHNLIYSILLTSNQKHLFQQILAHVDHALCMFNILTVTFYKCLWHVCKKKKQQKNL